MPSRKMPRVRKKKKTAQVATQRKKQEEIWGGEKLFYIAHRHKSNSALKRIIERRNRLYHFRPRPSSIIKTHRHTLLCALELLGNFLFDCVFIVVGESLSPRVPSLLH
jgi:hypothetical protein